VIASTSCDLLSNCTMERLQELINQLKEQFEHQAPPAQMLQTARLLEAELAQLSTQAALSKVSANVAVMMPSSMKIYTGQAAMKEVDKTKNGAVNGNGINGAGQRPVIEFIPDDTPEKTPVPEKVPEQKAAPEVRLTPDPAVPPRPATKEQQVGPWPYDPLAEIPTLAQQQPRELNDVIGTNGSSLNDKLKSNVLELKSALNDTPVRDLKKAIGVNDRFVFISQLFRGDEVMYERSLKTINGFRILPEAEYWMERELKVKLGWDESRDATKQFYHLVRRRFS